jgi:hypothetical protein
VNGRYGECNYALANPAYEDVESLCDMLDNDCDGRTDEGCGCAPGETRPCGTDVGACEAGVLRCVDGVFGECEDAVEAQPETCNGIDDDCDGTPDELDAVCDTELMGRCATGRLQCDGEAERCMPDEMPDDEVCNGVDDDCDGLVDDGLDDLPCNTGERGICRTGLTRCDGVMVACDVIVQPDTMDERCNGLDDDCDGEIDNLPFEVCVSGQLGECNRGRQACNARGERYCAPIQERMPEVCDLLDNDCDGLFDENIPSVACNLGGQDGVCNEGRTTCVDGEERCVPAELGVDDATCDGVDDDCDGQSDENFRPERCDTGLARCRDGTFACIDGELICRPDPRGGADNGPDGIDQDCDGVVDEDNLTLYFEDLMMGGTGARPGEARGPVPGYNNGIVRGVNPFDPDLSPVPIVDQVFKPGDGPTVVSSTGLIYDFAADVGSSESWSPPAKGPWEFVERGLPPLGVDHMLELHSNMGITFDLRALDMMYPNHQLHQMRSRAGSSDRGQVKIMLLVDGLYYDDGGCIAQDGPGRPNLESLRNLDGRSLRAARFITFVAVDCDQGNIGNHHGLVHDARLVLQPR